MSGPSGALRARLSDSRRVLQRLPSRHFHVAALDQLHEHVHHVRIELRARAPAQLGQRPLHSRERGVAVGAQARHRVERVGNGGYPRLTRYGVAGEPVLYLQLRLFYVHKGIEKRFERLSWRHGLFLAESISGDTAVGHALAYAHAVERLADVTPPARARALRVVLLELERLYNHTSDIGALATDVAYAVPASRAQALREGLVRMQDRVFGTRLLRNTIALGGVTRDLPAPARNALHAHLHGFGKEFDELIRLLVEAGTFTDRVDGAGILTHRAARDLGVVGMAARASGVDGDLRRDHPHDAYEGLRFDVPVEDGGDARARLMVRAREVEQSLAILDQVLAELPDTPLVARLPERLPASAGALGWVEAWRGPCTHWIATDAQGEVTRVKVTDPSFLNWPGLVQAVPGNIIPDFPVINKSFNLSYSGNDR